MSEEMKQKAIEIAKQALEKYVFATHCNLTYIAKKHPFRYQVECDVAGFIKKAFDKEYKSEKWQCIVGRKFGMTL